MSLQLDLHRKKVGYSDSRSSRKRDIYNIMSSSAKMNGRLVSNVTYKTNTGRGGFVKRGSTWHEIALPSGRSRFTFREVVYSFSFPNGILERGKIGDCL